MKTFFADIIPKIQKYSQMLDNLTLLTNQHWVLINEETNAKYVYIFRTNNELLLSINGKVDKGKWEYLGNNALLIERSEGSYLFRQGFFDENVLALKVDGKEEYAFMVNENKFEGEINSIDKVLDFLNEKYLKYRVDNNEEHFVKLPENVDEHCNIENLKYKISQIVKRGIFRDYDMYRVDFPSFQGMIYSYTAEQFFVQHNDDNTASYYRNMDSAAIALYLYETKRIIYKVDLIFTR